MKEYEDGSFVYESMHAEQLLNELYQPHPRLSVFRGQGKANYKLVPTALREDGLDKLYPVANLYSTASSSIRLDRNANDIQEICEALVLLEFYEKANLQGIDIPNITMENYGSPFSESQHRSKEWMPNSWMDLAALAQHYGLPTRMLDWTRDMTVAAYFLTRSLRKGTLDEKATIWQLDTAKVNMITTEVRFVVPEYSKNPNLKAQKGLLSCYTNKVPDQRMPLDEFLQNTYDSLSEDQKKIIMSDHRPILRRIDIDKEEVATVLSNFEYRSIGDSTFFPGLKAIADEMQSRPRLYKI